MERLLADIERRLVAEGAQAHLPPRTHPPGPCVPVPSDRGDAIAEVWQACLAAAALYIPALAHHRPFGSNR